MKLAKLLLAILMFTTLGYGQTFVQINSAVSSTATTTLTIPFTSPQTPGNLNIVAIGWDSSAPTVSSVTDTGGNTYQVAAPKTCSSTDCQTIMYAKNIAGGSNTVTVTFSASSAFPEARVSEYAGLDKVSPFDVQASVGSSGTTAANSGSATTTFANELIFGSGATLSDFVSPGSGFTNRLIDTFGSISEDRAVTSIGSYSASGTINASNVWIMQMATFKVATLAPTVTSISPTSGPDTGGTSVTITGTGFVTGATVKVGGTSATGVTFNSSTSLTAVTPIGTAGAVDVVVTNPDTQTGTLTSGFTYTTTGIQFVQVAAVTPQTPVTTTSIAYPSNQVAGNLNVVVVGWNDATASVSTVTDTRGNAYQIASPMATGTGIRQAIYYAKNIAAGANTVTVTFSPAAAFVDVRVLEYSGADLVFPFDVQATGNGLTAGSVCTGNATTTSPKEILVGAGTTYGRYTDPGVGFVTRILTNPDTDIAEDDNVTTTGSYSACATNTGGTANWIFSMATFRAAGQIPAPTVSSITPNTGLVTGGTSVIIAGTGFMTGATVTLGGTAATSVVVVSSTSITAITPAHIVGAVNIVVTNLDSQTGTLTNGFTYTSPPNPDPTVISIAPTSGPVSGGTSTTITGTGFLTGATVTFGGTSGTGVSVNSSTSITATAPAHSAGAINIIVTNTDAKSGTLTNGFTYVAAPTVSGVVPNNGLLAGSTSVSILGTGFLTGATVKFGGVNATNVVVSNSTTITAKTPASSAGVVSVSVTNTDGQTGTMPSAYTYINPAPTASSVAPTTGPINGGTGIIITGTGFISGATVTVGGTSASASVLSSTSISATTPAHALGLVSIIVTNPDSQAVTLSNSFTYTFASAAPTVTLVNPSIGSVDGSSNVTITGTNFSAGTVITIDGTTLVNQTFVNSTTITGTTVSHSAGIVDVMATNTDTQVGTLTGGYIYVDTSGGGTTAAKATGSVTITGTEQTLTSSSVPSSAQVTLDGTCVTACGPFSVTVNGVTDSISYAPGTNSGIAFSQANSNQSASQSVVTVVMKKAQAVGNLNIVVIKWNSTGSSIKSVTDTMGNSYKIAVPQRDGFGATQAIYYASNVKAAAARTNSVSVNFDKAATFPDVHVYEYAGLGALDVNTSSTGTSNPTDSGSVTTNFSSELLFGAGTACGEGFTPTNSVQGVGFIKPGNGFLQRQLTPYGGIGEDRVVFATGTYKASGLVNCSGWVMQMATFWAGVTSDILANRLAAKINSDRLIPVNAVANGSVITLTTKSTGPQSTYGLSSVTCCNIGITSSGTSLSGGSGVQTIPDTGVISVTINGVAYSYNYGLNDTPNSIASSLASIINASPNTPVVAVAAGSTVNLTSKDVGSTNFPIVVSTISNNSSFPNPSFNIVASGPTMTGGAIQHSVQLIWSASVSGSTAGYNVYRSNVHGGPYTLLSNLVTGLSYNDTTILSGGTYYYVVTSVDNTSVEGVFSTEATAVIPIP